ncbi:glycoside hydrolase/deacetylase [Mycena alexandri]|uniref:chitin deacetylase n=1 Tax=Mycena alexandri TaxID=1745969 RepID=A0AAD6TET3_9AGAR|nr:glycoside hydrolase/deacetylase [Mycena alexandri]
MSKSSFVCLAAVTVAAAYNIDARQVSGVSVGTSAGPQPTQTSFSFTLATTNPTAIPLASIVSNAATQATHTLATTYAPGSIPTVVSGAPPLPNAALLAPSNYPALDKVVPTDSPEVQQWIKDVANSGVTIPDFAPTVDSGACGSNAAAVADTTRCWWTCTGCVTATDITTCPNKLTWGFTYDDGPSPYTEDLLQFLDQNNLKTTFFAVGSRVISFPNILQTEYMGGHQIGVHTWSHPPLTTLTNDQIIGELGWSKKVIKDVLGVTPLHFRPPFGDIDNRVRAIAQAMGLTPVIWTRISPQATFDTDDFDLHSGLTTASHVLQNWNYISGNASIIDTGFILLEHDLFQQSVDIATGYILPDALLHQPPFKIVPVIECQNKPLSDAYLELNDNSSNPLPSGSVPSSSANAAGSSTGSTGSGGSGSSKGSAAVATAGLPGLGAVFALALAILAGTTLLMS